MSPAARRAQIQSRLADGDAYPRWVLLTALAGMFATTFPITLLTLSLKTIAEDFGTTETLISWVIAGPLLASAVALPILGKMGDLYGHRRVFITGFVASTVITAATTFAWDPYSLILLRGLAVVTGAATMPTAMALINSVYPPNERAKAMGWWAFVAAGAPAIGIVIGAPLIDAVGWRPMFGIQAVLSVVPVVAAFLVLHETKDDDPVRFDVLGSLCIALGAGGLMLALNQFPERGADALVLACTTVGLVGVTAFVAVERRVEAPLLPLEFFGRRNFRASMLASLFSGGAYMGGFVLAPLLLQSAFGYSVTAAGLIMLIRPGSFAIASPIGGSIASKIGERPVSLAGTIGITLAMLALGIGTQAGVIALVLVGLLLQGIGNGGAQPTLTAALSNSVDESDLGIAAAGQRMMFQVGSAVGITVMTAVYGGTEQPADFLAAYAVGAGLAFLAVVFAWGLQSGTPEQRLRATIVLHEDERVVSTTSRATLPA